MEALDFLNCFGYSLRLNCLDFVIIHKDSLRVNDKTQEGKLVREKFTFLHIKEKIIFPQDMQY